MEEIVRTQIMIMRVSVDFSRFTFILVTLALLVLVGCSRHVAGFVSAVDS